jgi:hypothetical protein
VSAIHPQLKVANVRMADARIEAVRSEMRTLDGGAALTKP